MTAAKIISPLRKLNRRNIFLFLALLGPGIITANVDNDAGGITTYSLAGAQFGLSLLWIMLPTTVALVVVQEMCARMGAVTGKGLSDLIRERFGVKITFYVMIALLLTNLGNTVSEFAGIAASMELFGVSRYVSVPLGAVAVWLLIVKGSYRIVEKVFLVACLVYVAYPVAAFFSGPDWGEVLKASVVPDFHVTSDAVTMMIGIVGTTIAPWMQFSAEGPGWRFVAAVASRRDRSRRTPVLLVGSPDGKNRRRGPVAGGVPSVGDEFREDAKFR